MRTIQTPSNDLLSENSWRQAREAGEWRYLVDAIMVLLMGLAAVACGGGGESLTCEYLASPENCWAKAAKALADCLPSRANPGVLASDRKTCTFSENEKLVFDTALPQDTMALERLGFAVEYNGSECGRFIDTFENRMELTGGGKTVVSELKAGGAFYLRCDGGGDYQTNFDKLFDCAAQTPNSVPTDGFEVTATSFEFSISSVSTPGVMFSCSQ